MNLSRQLSEDELKAGSLGALGGMPSGAGFGGGMMGAPVAGLLDRAGQTLARLPENRLPPPMVGFQPFVEGGKCVGNPPRGMIKA